MDKDNLAMMASPMSQQSNNFFMGRPSVTSNGLQIQRQMSYADSEFAL